MNNPIIIDNITIKTDSEGRYCLNDLHKAAGGAKKHQPADFFKNQSTRDLVQELRRNSENLRSIDPIETVMGRNGGTYVVKELVYAYAMWISPAFHLKVIRAYGRLATQGIAVHESAAEDMLKNPLAYFERVLEQAKALQAANQQLTHERDGLASNVGKHMHSLARFARTLPGVNTQMVKRDLMRAG